MIQQKMAKLYDCDIADIFLAVSSTKRLKNFANNIDK